MDARRNFRMGGASIKYDPAIRTNLEAPHFRMFSRVGWGVGVSAYYCPPYCGRPCNHHWIYCLFRLAADAETLTRTWRLRCLPKFYLIGLAKCGTTDLFAR